jgi:hypothetical protein
MSLDYTTRTARHALAHRIDRLIRALEKVGRPPNRREVYYLVKALQCLQDGRCHDGESAMRDAERVAPLPPSISSQPRSNDLATSGELRQALEELMRVHLDSSSLP